METKELVNCLSEEKVFVKYLVDKRNGIEDRTHPLYGGLSSNAFIGICAPLLSKRITKIFSKDELDFLSNELNEDLGVNANFWKEFSKDKSGTPYGIFPICLRKEGALFNKNNALDYIKIRVLEDNDIIANNQEEVTQRQGCRFVLISEKDMYKKETAGRNFKKAAYKLYEKYENDIEVLRYTLRSFNKSVDMNSKIDFLQNEVWNKMEENPKVFVTTLEDKHLKTKILISDFLNYELINKNDNLYYDLSGKKLSLDSEIPDLEGAARYLDSGVGGEFRLGLEAKVKAMKK
jgi:hypothetical protein